MSAATAAWVGLLAAVVITALVIANIVLVVGLAVGALLGYGTKDIIEWERRRWQR